jgi:type II secretory pathway component PulJ
MIIARRASGRRGHSLIEMVLVIGVLAIVLGLCAGLLHALFRLDRAGRNSVGDASNLARLARDFREDVRSARTARPQGAEGAGLELDKGDGDVVIYRTEGPNLYREEVHGGKPVRRERYESDRLGTSRFDVTEGRVRLALSKPKAETPGLAGPTVTVEAVLGKHRRLSGIEEARK